MPSALITGASKGIGFETALAFARAGYQVFATMRNPAQAPELGRIVVDEKLPITISAMDVDNDDSVREAFAAIHQQSDTIDVLVNNAGIERLGSIEELPLAEFRAVMETNYFGAIRCIQAVVPGMRERGSGCIINVTSIAGRISSPPFGPYAATKFALEALSESLAAEMKTFGVRVAIVQPGIIDTAMARRIETGRGASPYSHGDRARLLFVNALQKPVHSSVVAKKILEIAQGQSWQLRYAVGPDAAPMLAWRKSMSDEDWVDLHASDTETWGRRMNIDVSSLRR